MLWGLISLKAVLIFPKNFLNFRSDMIEKQDIINLSSYCSKNYPSVVLSDFEVTFLGERGGCSFLLFLYHVLFMHNVTELKKYAVKFPCSPTFVKARTFSAFIIFSVPCQVHPM